MTLNAVAAGMTPFRPSPPPSPTGPDTVRSWGTPSCADDLAELFGARRPAPAVPAVPTAPAGLRIAPRPHAFLSERQPGGWTCVSQPWDTDAGRADVLDRYLTTGERAVYDGLSVAVQPSWLLGRVAAKDAVRWWLADRGETVAPYEIPLANEPSGRPVIDAGVSSWAARWAAIDLRISIAHVTGTGVAIVARGSDVGIDVEETAPRPGSFARVAFSRDERAERAARTAAPPETSCCGGEPPDPHITMDEATWMAAAWCAKEAAGKAAGTGLQGRPTRFVTRLVGPDLFTVGDRLVRCTQLDPVRYCSFAGHSLVVGWTLSVDREVDVRTGAAHPEMSVAPRPAHDLLATGAGA